jgi:hypothetical protein
VDGHADTSTWLRERIDSHVAAGVGVAWLVLTLVAVSLEPPTNRPEPLIGVMLGILTWVLLATMVTGLVMERRFGLVASLGSAVLFTAAAIACPVSGHHSFGMWWFGQMACALVLVGISIAALRWTTDGVPPAWLSSRDDVDRADDAETDRVS